MAAQTEPAASRQRERRTEESTYVVQIDVSADGKSTWEDIARVTVPSRTKRKSVISAGLKQANIAPDGTIRVRALSAESAEPLSVSVETPEPQLRFG